MLVTIDIGNSRLKAALWKAGEICQSEVLDYERDRQQMPQQVAQFCQLPLFAEHDISRIQVACVAGDAVEQALLGAAQNINLPVPEFFRTSRQCCGITHGYTEPSQHGVDRWAALLGARKLSEGALCVISVGTAVTVDILDARNRHLGGRIMPGLNMMASALQQGTSGVQQVEGEPVKFATNTADAVSSGTFYMLLAAIEQTMLDAQCMLDANMRTFLTGGQAHLFYQAMQHKQQHADMTLQLQPQLVMHGLHVVAENS